MHCLLKWIGVGHQEHLPKRESCIFTLESYLTSLWHSSYIWQKRILVIHSKWEKIYTKCPPQKKQQQKTLLLYTFREEKQTISQDIQFPKYLMNSQWTLEPAPHSLLCMMGKERSKHHTYSCITRAWCYQELVSLERHFSETLSRVGGGGQRKQDCSLGIP